MLNELAIFEAETIRHEHIPETDPVKSNNETLEQIATREGVDMTSKVGLSAMADSHLMTDDLYPNLVLPAKILPGGQQGLFGADFIHPDRATQAIVADSFVRLYREKGLGENKSNAGLLNISVEKAADPWKPLAERQASQ